RRLYVADRYNGRIQIFDENGKFLDQWPGMKQPFDITITVEKYVWVTDGESNRFFKYDMNGKFLYAFGYYGFFPGGLYGLHQFSVRSEGNRSEERRVGKECRVWWWLGEYREE